MMTPLMHSMLRVTCYSLILYGIWDLPIALQALVYGSVMVATLSIALEYNRRESP